MPFVFFNTLFLFLFAANSLSAFSPDNGKVKTVVIDAGHGGKDPGAIGYSKSYEKNITLAVSLKLGEMIKKNYPGIKVVYTRDKDEFIELHDRAAIANKHSADLFISIHCNSSTDKTAYGAEIYCLGLHRTEANLEVAKRENSVILLEDNYVDKYDGFDPNAAEAHIIFSLFQSAFLNQSISFASNIDHQFPATAGRRSRGVKQAGFLVLYKTTMPGVLVELGFISNRDEDAFLKSDLGQMKTALALFKSFENYLNEKAQGENIKNETPIEKETPVVKEEPVEVKPQPTEVKPQPVVETPAKPTPAPAAVKKPVEVVKEASKSPERVPDDNTPEFIFKVQFMASKVRIPESDAKLKQVIDWEIETTETGYHRYMTGKFISLRTAEEMQKVLQQIGYTDAFIAPYMHGTERITIKEYLEKYQK
jgi:N-acetylmuramoyl-L-alanine amidase